MPVLVKLLDLVALDASQDLWPPDFKAFTTEIRKNPTERLAWGACADWLDGNDEPELARAFRYVCKRPDITPTVHCGEWMFKGLPEIVNDAYGGFAPARRTSAAGAAALLYHALVRAEETMLKKIQQLKEDVA